MHTPLPPPLSVDVREDQQITELKGWTDLDTWGMRNHPHWHALRRMTESFASMSEVDKLRMIAGELLRLNVTILNENIEMYQRTLTPTVVVKSDLPKAT